MADPGTILDSLSYSKEHEWVRIEGEVATVGISDYAQRELGDIVYVDHPRVGAEVKQMGEMGVVESVKVASDIYSPIAGTVTEVNAALESSPELINNEPYEGGWIARLRVSGEHPAEGLMSAEDYRKYIESL